MATQTMSRLPFWRQLRSNLIVLFVLLALVPLAAVGYFTIHQIRTQTTKQVINQLDSVSVLKQAQIEGWLESADLSMDVFLSHAATRDQFAQFLTAANPDSQSEQAIDTTLTEAIELGGTDKAPFKELFIYTLDGHVLAGSNLSLVGRVVNRQPYFNASLTSRHLESPYYEVGTGELTMMLTTPLTDNQGQMVGVIAARLDLSKLGSILLERAGLGDTGETYLVSQENNYPLTPLRAPGFSPTRAYHSDGIDRALKGENGSGEYTGYQNSAVIGVFRWIPELKVALLSEIDQTEALALFDQTQQLVIELALVAAFLAAVVGLFSASRIAAPIIALTQTATRVAQGDLTQRAQIHSRSESGMLATAFNTMTDQLVTNIGQLDQKVQEVETANKALRVATAQAKEAARLKSEFLSTMSHELRTPLNAIIGFCGIILEGMGGEVDDEARGMLQRINDNSERLLGLINEVLDLARIEAGRMELVSGPMSPKTLAERWSSQMMALSQQKGLNFEVDVDPDLPAIVYGDGARITQIAINLLSNAFKFTETGTVRLEMRRDTETWLIRVVDTGVGIPPHALNYIFDEFRQVDGSSRRMYGGSGLGLAIVRNLARIMNGQVKVTSELGKGSTFTVSLPLITRDEAQPVLELA